MLSSNIKLISYSVGPDAEREIKKFIDFHSSIFDKICDIRDSVGEKPLNSCKIKAVEHILNEINLGNTGIYILCDIDTRILRLRALHKVIRTSDAAFYFRHASPMHLSNLSGFMVFNVSEENAEYIKTFIRGWIHTYETKSTDWYSDQRSLILSIYNCEINKEFTYVDLSKYKSRLSFNWSTTPFIFVDAVTHKGKDKYFIFSAPYSLRWPALVIDQIMIIFNTMRRIWDDVVRLSNF